MTKTMTSLYIDENILHELDRESKKRGLPRQTYINHILIEAIRNDELRSKITKKLDLEAENNQLRKEQKALRGELRKLMKYAGTNECRDDVGDEYVLDREWSRLKKMNAKALENISEYFLGERVKTLNSKLENPISVGEYRVKLEEVIAEAGNGK